MPPRVKPLIEFHAAFYLLRGRLGASLGLDGIARRFHVQRSDHQPAVVVDADLLLRRRRLTLRLVHLVDVLDDLEVRTHAGELQRVIAVRSFEAAGCLDVSFGGAPHEGNHLVQRIALALELLHGDRRRAAEQVRHDVVGLEAAGNVEHLRPHLHAGCRHGEGFELEPLRLREVLEDRQRLLARRVVVEEVGELLVLEAAAQLLLGEIDRGRPLRPVAGGEREEDRGSACRPRLRQCRSRARCRGSCPLPASWSAQPSAAYRRGSRALHLPS